MANEWDPIDLIKAVEDVVAGSTTHDQEGLLLALCTKIKNGCPFPQMFSQKYRSRWDYVLLDLWRYT